MLGLGTVGSGVVRLLRENASIVQGKRGAKLNLTRIAVRHTEKDRGTTLVPVDDPLSAIDGVCNAIRVTGNYAGTVMFSGRGAGREPTASAVAGHLTAIARNILVAVGRRIAPLGRRY